MSRLGRDGCVRVGGFPRVSGDEPLALALDSVQAEFSPRERG